ncbi:MAG TPA: hypothetical protein VFT96_00415 [Gemmatimonadaceae bacterium]|nr:hypothetical protein [Gemmatimonadaceae bacterium]
MRKTMMVLALAATAALGACQKTGEGEYKVETPDVDVSTDTSTVRTPTVDVGTKQDTMIVKTPTVDVDAPGNKTPDDTKTGTGTRNP